MFYRNTSQSETPSVIRNGSSEARAVTVRQHSTAAPALYLQVFDSASPTPGTTKPLMVLPIPAGVRSRKFQFSGGILMGNGLSIAVTTAPDNGTGPSASDRPEVILSFEAR